VGRCVRVVSGLLVQCHSSLLAFLMIERRPKWTFNAASERLPSAAGFRRTPDKDTGISIIVAGAGNESSFCLLRRPSASSSPPSCLAFVNPK